MSPRKSSEAESKWSQRSAASLGREAELLGLRAQIQSEIDYAHRKLAEAQGTRQSCVQVMGRGNAPGHTPGMLDKALHDIANLGRRLQALNEYAAELDGKLAAESAIVPGRAAKQEQLAELAATRLEQDGVIQETVNRLLALLDQRAETTAKMAGLAEQIEFSGDLDNERFEQFAASLPVNLLAESERRMNALLGVPGDDFVTVVTQAPLQRAESLRHAGIHEAGESLLLAPNEFAILNWQSKQFMDESQRRAEEDAIERRVETLALQISRRTIPPIPLEAARLFAREQIRTNSVDPYRPYTEEQIERVLSASRRELTTA